jgi:ABC-2 type transport system permease protein
VQRILRSASTIFWLGTKELRSFLRDTVLIVLVIYTFSLAVISQAQSNSQELNKASIAVADEDNSPLSRRIMHAFLPPLFLPPQPIAVADIVPSMNAGHFTFVVDFRGRFGIRVKLITGPCGPTSNACPRRLTFLDR